MTLTKKILVLVFASAFTHSSINAQDKKDDDDDKCVKKGTIIADTYYGYPYMFGKYVQGIADASATGISTTNLNHLGGRAEFMITDVIGIGAEYTYAAVFYKYSETETVYQSSTGTYVDKTNTYNVSITKQRFLAKFNAHFGTSKFLDPYATAGVGYKQSIIKSDNPDDQEAVDDLNSSFLNLLPVAFRVGIGLRYYPIKYVGIGVEAGVGGPIVQGGLTFKF